ncbi:hypothetical protein [Methylobacterium sp. JK268]
MNSEHQQRILDRLAFVVEAKKTFDSAPKWERVPYRDGERLQLTVALRVAGVLRAVTLRLVTPADVWEEDVYGHLEVRGLGLAKHLRLLPIEWRPLHHHDNPPDAPAPHAGLRLFDRFMPFDLNMDRGLGVFAQNRPAVMVDLPRAPTDFLSYCDLCSDLWRCPDMIGLEPPPWSRAMI